MSVSLPASSPQRRALRLVATIIAGLVVLFVANTARSGSQDSASPLDTQSLLTIPAFDSPQPTAIATTAPIELPTTMPTAAPTATAIATVEPTATSAPTSTAVPPAPQPAAEARAAVSVADAGSTTGSADAQPAPTEAVQAPAPTTTPAPTTAAPTATSIPNPTPRTDTVVETAEPTPEPTATPTPTPTPIPLQTAEQLEAYVLGEINAVRAKAGLGPIALDPTISIISRDWSQQMAAGGFFDHRPGDQLNVMLPSGWRQWGENIASAPDIFWAQSSLENSPGHYANMVGPFTHVGIGVYTTGNQVWVTQNFARYD